MSVFLGQNLNQISMFFFRKLAKSIFFKIILAFVALSFVLFGVSSFILGSPNTWVAKIGGDTVSYGQFNSALRADREVILASSNKSEEALKYLEKAIVIARRSSPDGTLFDHIGDVLFRLKKFDRAKEAWIEAQKHLESGKAGEKLAKSLKTKLENVESMPKQVKTDKAPNP